MFTATAIIAGIGAALGSIAFLFTLAGTKSAPQEAAGAAIALCFVIIPYCINGLVWRAQMLSHQKREP